MYTLKSGMTSWNIFLSSIAYGNFVSFSKIIKAMASHVMEIRCCWSSSYLTAGEPSGSCGIWVGKVKLISVSVNSAITSWLFVPFFHREYDLYLCDADRIVVAMGFRLDILLQSILALWNIGFPVWSHDFFCKLKCEQKNAAGKGILSALVADLPLWFISDIDINFDCGGCLEVFACNLLSLF